MPGKVAKKPAKKQESSSSDSDDSSYEDPFTKSKKYYGEESIDSMATKRKRRKQKNSRSSTGSHDSGNVSLMTTSDEHEEDTLVERTMEHLGLTRDRLPLNQMTREEQGRVGRLLRHILDRVAKGSAVDLINSALWECDFKEVASLRGVSATSSTGKLV